MISIETTIKLLNVCKRPTFIGLHHYETAAGEVQNVVLNIGLDYYVQKERDVDRLNNLDIESISLSSGLSIKELERARDEIRVSLHRHRKSSVYVDVAPGLKKHHSTGQYYLTGFCWKGLKKVIKPGTYSSSSFDRAKNELNKYLISPSYRQYKIEQLEELKVNKILVN
jgi:hypothetical protein